MLRPQSAEQVRLQAIHLRLFDLLRKSAAIAATAFKIPHPHCKIQILIAFQH
jgi:hypothetical protein